MLTTSEGCRCCFLGDGDDLKQIDSCVVGRSRGLRQMDSVEVLFCSSRERRRSSDVFSDVELARLQGTRKSLHMTDSPESRKDIWHRSAIDRDHPQCTTSIMHNDRPRSCATSTNRNRVLRLSFSFGTASSTLASNIKQIFDFEEPRGTAKHTFSTRLLIYFFHRFPNDVLQRFPNSRNKDSRSGRKVVLHIYHAEPEDRFVRERLFWS